MSQLNIESNSRQVLLRKTNMATITSWEQILSCDLKLFSSHGYIVIHLSHIENVSDGHVKGICMLCFL